MSATEFTARARRRERVVGYWMTLDSPVLAERLAGVGYDYVVLDAQHGELDGRAQAAALIAVDAAAGAPAVWSGWRPTTPPRSVAPWTPARRA